MPEAVPEAAPSRFLLRGSLLLIGFLLLWWVALQSPLLAMLRVTAGSIGALVFGIDLNHFVNELPSGAWTFRIPMEVVSAQRQIHSIDFDIPRGDLVAFTFSLPVYWAIILAAPSVRSAARPLLLGTVLIALLEVVLLLCFVEIWGQNIGAQFAGVRSEFNRWLLRLSEYLIVSVIPFLAPIVVALTLHDELRAAVFPRRS